MTLIFVLCFRVSFINYSFDHYIFILGGGIGKKVQFLEASNFSFQIIYLKFNFPLNYWLF